MGDGLAQDGQSGVEDAKAKPCSFKVVENGLASANKLHFRQAVRTRPCQRDRGQASARCLVGQPKTFATIQNTATTRQLQRSDQRQTLSTAAFQPVAFLSLAAHAATMALARSASGPAGLSINTGTANPL
jgi:hypothetical protein